MPTASGAPAIEYGHLYNTAQVTVSGIVLDTYTDVVDDGSDLTAQAYKTAVDKTTGTIEVGEGDWKFTLRIRYEGATATDDVRCRVRVVDGDADSTESSPHGVVTEQATQPAEDGGSQQVIVGVAQNLSKGAVIKAQVLNGTGTGNIEVEEFDLFVEALKTNPHRQVKTSTTAS